MTPLPDRVDLPSRERLDEVFRLKYGDPATTGWGPRMRLRFGYFTPDDVYEGLIADLVTDGCAWLDVGCGRDIFPFNVPLAQQVAARCEVIVGVDPAPTLTENDLVHVKVPCTIDEYEPDRQFDLLTLRMVAEHVEQPDRVVEVLARCAKPGGLVVVYTVNRWSPVPLMTSLIPFGLHQPVKRVLWRTDEKDTFPTCFRMNTRGRLRSLFAARGFAEVGFAQLDDCRTFGRFRPLLFAELTIRAALRVIGLGYPERCLLGVYRKT